MPHLRSMAYGPGPLASSGGQQTTLCCGPHIELGTTRIPGRAHTRSVRGFHLACSTAVRTQGVQLRKFFALGAESLILRKVPVEDVHLHRFEAVEIALRYRAE